MSSALSRPHLVVRLLVCSMAAALLATSVSTAQEPLYTPAPSYSSVDRWVSTSFFYWFISTGGQTAGPWLPLEGRAAWDGETPFWKRQVKDVMDAQIDVMFVHVIVRWRTQRQNLFRAIRELREEGYDVPRVVPFLDPLIIWHDAPNNSVNLATAAGKDELMRHYIDWFTDYFNANNDPDDAHEDDYLGRLGGKVMLDSWIFHSPWRPEHRPILNVSSLTRQDMESRLQNAFSAAHPVFDNGIYFIMSPSGNNTNNPNWVPTWTDEIIAQFAQDPYWAPFSFNNKRTFALTPSRWDQNVRTEAQGGKFFPRDNATHYGAAWGALEAIKEGFPKIYHTYIESWNEYNEGSGIFEADPGKPFVISPPNPHTEDEDRWSDRYDPDTGTGDVAAAARHYIDITADNAPVFTGRTARDAEFIYFGVPPGVAPGATFSVILVARNQGSEEWSPTNPPGTPGPHKLGIRPQSPFKAAGGGRRFLLSPSQDEISKYGGIFRGRPKTFNIQVKAPTSTGTRNLIFRMLQENVAWFGEQLTVPVLVGDAISVDFGNADVNYRLQRRTPEPSNANTKGTFIGGRSCRRNVNGADRHFFMSVDDSWAFREQSGLDVDVTIVYYDQGTDAIRLVYDAVSGDKSAGLVNLTNTNTWKTKTWHLTDAYFGNRSGVGYDFRLTSKTSGKIFYIDSVRLSK